MGRRQSQLYGFLGISGSCLLFAGAIMVTPHQAVLMMTVFGLLLLTMDGTPYLTTFVLPQAQMHVFLDMYTIIY